MSSWDTDSSSDSIPLIVYANNNRLPGSNDSVAESDSEDNESIQDNSDTSSGDSHNDAILLNTDDSDIGPNSPTLSFAIDDPFLENLYQDNINVTAPKPNWCTPKELYNREIGKYSSPAIWCNKFYGSMTAVQKLKLVHQLKGHRGCVNTLDFNPGGDIIASGSDDQNICLWNWSLGKCLLKYDSGHHENVYQTRFLLSQGDIRIVSCGRDGLVRLSAVGKSHLYYNKLLASHYHSCNKLSVHKDLPYVVLSCGDDGVVKSIDIRESPIYENVNSTNIQKICNENGSVVRLFGVDTNPMNSLEFIVHGDDKFVRMYDKRKLKKEPVKIFCRKGFSMIEGVSHITSAVYNYCGTEILASYSEDDIYLFDVNSSPDTHLHQYGGHLNKITVKGVNFYGPKGEFVVSGSDCGHIFIWDKKTEAIVQKKHADANGIVNVLEPHPHIPTLATSGLDKTIKIWQPLKGCIEPNILKLKKSIIQNRIERERGIRRD